MAEPNEPPQDEPADEATEELVSYLDGELDRKAAESLATRISLDPKLRAEADSLQRAWDILDILPRPQPSPTFATRTLTQAVPALQQSGPVGLDRPVRSRTDWVFWAAASVVVFLSGLAGYVGHAAFSRDGKEYEQISKDAGLLHNLRLYRYVDDMEFARALDDPELFGEGE